MKSEIEQAVEYIKGSSIHNNDIYAQEALAIIEQGFIELEETIKLVREHNKIWKDIADTNKSKLNKISELVKEGVHLYETYPGEFHKPEKMYKIKQILDKE